jgi:hypothetical protein
MPERELLIAKANAQMAKWPQYLGLFDDYIVVKIKTNVKTKMGLAFVKGEVTIAKPKIRNEFGVLGWCVYSFSNQCNTIINANKVEVL